MQVEQLKDLPAWAQAILSVFAGLGLMYGLAKKYASSEQAKAPSGDHMVLSATLADGHALRDLIDEIRELRGSMQDGAEQRHRDVLNQIEATERLCRATNENTEAKRAGAITPDMLALLARLTN